MCSTSFFFFLFLSSALFIAWTVISSVCWIGVQALPNPAQSFEGCRCIFAASMRHAGSLLSVSVRRLVFDREAGVVHGRCSGSSGKRLLLPPYHRAPPISLRTSADPRPLTWTSVSGRPRPFRLSRASPYSAFSTYISGVLCCGLFGFLSPPKFGNYSACIVRLVKGFLMNGAGILFCWLG